MFQGLPACKQQSNKIHYFISALCFYLVCRILLAKIPTSKRNVVHSPISINDPFSVVRCQNNVLWLPILKTFACVALSSS